MWRQMEIKNCYTLESSFAGSSKLYENKAIFEIMILIFIQNNNLIVRNHFILIFMNIKLSEKNFARH